MLFVICYVLVEIIIYKKNMKCEPKKIKFEVKLESIDPAGLVLKSEELSMIVVDDKESMINNDRLFIHIGECLYRINNKGFIIDRVIPIKAQKQ